MSFLGILSYLNMSILQSQYKNPKKQILGTQPRKSPQAMPCLSTTTHKKSWEKQWYRHSWSKRRANGIAEKLNFLRNIWRKTQKQIAENLISYWVIGGCLFFFSFPFPSVRLSLMWKMLTSNSNSSTKQKKEVKKERKQEGRKEQGKQCYFTQ